MSSQRLQVLPIFAAVALILGVTGCGPHKAGSTGGSDGPTSGPAAVPEPLISIAAMGQRVPVLRFDKLDQRNFAKTLEKISDEGYVPITLDQLYAQLTSGTEVSPKALVLTFDDASELFKTGKPMLEKYKFPYAVFVSGMGEGKPSLSTDQLNELAKDHSVTIGVRLAAGTRISQSAEGLAVAKKSLESALNGPCYYASSDQTEVEGAAGQQGLPVMKQAGYRMAVCDSPRLAQESASLACIGRFDGDQLMAAMTAASNALDNGPAAVVVQELNNSPVRITVGDYEGLTIGFVTGGLPMSVLSKTREGVADFVRDAKGAAGINGSFFALAGLQDTSNVMIGPCYTSEGKDFLPENSGLLLKKLRNRPMVMWDGKKIAMFNFQPEALNREAPYRQFMPGFTDLFLGGAWIVHAGVGRLNESMIKYAAHDLDQTRRRAFFGWNARGEPVIGASLQTCSTERLAEAAAASGVQEAVLLDSGFSTSLVFDGRVIITGHTAKNLPSRPVPHAIVLMGSLDKTGADAMIALAKDGARSPADIEGEKRARERRRVAKLAAAQKLIDDKAAKDAAAANAPLGDPNTAPPGVAAPGDPGSDPFAPPPEKGTGSTGTTGGGETTGGSAGTTSTGEGKSTAGA